MANPVLARLTTTVFEEMSGLARQFGAINLGQGFPDTPGPLAIRERAAQAVVHGNSQYPPMRGVPELRQALSRHYGRRQGLAIDPETQIVITSGATEALACCFLGLIEPGDEVVLFQPVFDTYAPMIRMAGGVPVFVTLKAPHWRIERQMLEDAFSPKTRLVVLNTPNNPTGDVAPESDLDLLAEFCERFDAIAICDEVWEQIVMDGAVHRPLLAHPKMKARCVKIGSAGKLFALTGWKIGWIIASPELSQILGRAHQYVTFSTAPGLQEAVAWGLENSDDWFASLPGAMQRSRDRLADGLRREGFAVVPGNGAYFLNVDLAASGIAERDRAFCLRSVKEAGVAAIPFSVFYEIDPVDTMIRLCFAKQDATLDAGVERLAKARSLSRA